MNERRAEDGSRRHSTLALVNGTIRTADERLAVARCLSVRGAHVAGSSSNPGAVPTEAELIDLGGRTVVPGFTDSHTHFPSWSLAQRQVRLEQARSADHAAELVATAVDGAARGDGWLRGYGWREGDWEDQASPSRLLLDAVAGDRPVALLSKDYHSLWLNSAGLARAGSADLAVDGGVVELLPDGSPSGVLRERAAWAFREEFERPTEDELVEATREGVRLAHRAGVTCVHDKDGWLDAIAVWQRLHREGELTLRVWQSLPSDRLPALARAGIRSNFGDAMLRAGYIKVFMDGTLSSGTALMADGSGVSVTSREEFREIVLEAAAAGFPIGVHAIGDLANREALDVFEETASVWRPLGLRQRIEHAQLLAPEDVDRFGRLGVAISCQFSHAPHDRDLVDSAWASVADRAYLFRSLQESGALLCNGSDAPVFDLDPLEGLRAAVTRTLDERPSWHPEEALTPEQALAAITTNPAWLSHDEWRRGRLAAGFLADLVVLDRDPLTCPAEELDRVKVVATMVDGQWVHNPPPWD